MTMGSYNIQIPGGISDEDLKIALDEVRKAFEANDLEPIVFGDPNVEIVELLQDKYEHFSRCRCESCIKNKKCECGAEKCGFNNHSDYCPKYIK